MNEKTSSLMRVTGAKDRSGNPENLEFDQYVPLQFQTFGAPLGAATVRLGNLKKTMLELAIEPHGQVVRGVTLTSMGGLCPWPEFSVVETSGGLPAIAGNFEGGEVVTLDDDFFVATKEGEALIFWEPLQTCSAYSYGAVRFLVQENTLVGVWFTGLSPKQTTLLRYHSLGDEPLPVAKGKNAGSDEPFVRYLFIWDKQEQKVVASYYFHREDRPDQIATDVSRGAIADGESATAIEALKSEFPTDRYLYGGGFAPSLEASVKGFFAMEKDFDGLS